jgi:hypothetical protein
MASPARAPVSRSPQVLPHAPDELTRGRLHRLGEGVGKVVFASEHWVVKRERSPAEVVALIVLWKGLRKAAHLLPHQLCERLLERPSKEIRFLRVLTQAVITVVPKSLWFMTHIGEVWRVYHWRNVRGESLAQAHLAGSELVPERVMFPPTRVRVDGWPGYLIVHEATERVESTLHQRLLDLAARGRFEEFEQWLERLLELRQSGWRRGLFSVDPHLKNFGISGCNIVLLDTGGLTATWSEIERRLEHDESVEEPHKQLGLGPALQARPDVEARFNALWKAIVNREHVLLEWLGDL